MHQESSLLMLQSGNQKVLPLLIIVYYDELFKLSFRITRNKLETEEIVQDAFSVLWQNRAGFTTSLSIRKYLFRVVKNKSLNSLKKSNRRKKRQNEYTQFSSERTIYIEIDKKNEEYLLIKLKREIEKLPTQPKIVLTLIILGKSIKEIASMMKLKEATVRSIKQRGISALRKKLRSFIEFF